MCKGVVMYINGHWEWHCASGTFNKKHTESAFHLYNIENRHFDPIIGFQIPLFKYLSYSFAIGVYLFLFIFI